MDGSIAYKPKDIQSPTLPQRIPIQPPLVQRVVEPVSVVVESPRTGGCPNRLGKGFGTATRTSPPRSLQGQFEGAPTGDEDVTSLFGSAFKLQTSNLKLLSPNSGLQT